MTQLRVAKLVHVNQLVDDFAGAGTFYADVFGAREYWRGYDEDQRRDASLFVVGDACFELFAPVDRTSLLGASLARFGNSWHSFEWQVPDLEEAAAALAERGIRVTTYRPGSFLMTHPADCHGLLLELCPLEMTGDPRIEAGWDPSPWRDEHPLGMTGLHGLSIAVRDAPAAADWLIDLVAGAEVAYREPRAEVDADAVGVRIADHVVELVQPRGTGGPIAGYIGRSGQRLRSVEFGVLDARAARAYLEEQGLRIVPGSREDAFAVAEEDNWGVRWEFAEQPAG
jgi:catechol 2,3-dioxygenase-like lactoylglutathione lyase family enzyme